MDETITQQSNKKAKIDRILRITTFVACELFTLASLIYFIASKRYDSIWTCAWTFLILLIPQVVSILLRVKANVVFFIVVQLYCLAPMMGHSYHFYYTVAWWDELLHTLGGVVFAILGAFLLKVINRGGKVNVFTTAFFALLFSISVSAVWELFEYAMDTFTGSDMQKDTFIDFIHSYLLGGKTGELGVIDKIDQIIINNTALEGYIDIGLIDTMTDILVETVGAVVFFVWYLIDRERHPLIVFHNRKKKE